ncbi:glycine N-acyltransferase-like [Ptychodera flava]|uniref:glycine N-acyltransferase-like n=1 Tax=Ptychodera flava TaxID=63121 RepID=UPI00396A288A
MARKLASPAIGRLVEMFKNSSPDCLSLYYLLKNSLKTDNTWPKIDVYADSEDLARLTSVAASWHPCDDGDEKAEVWYFFYSLDSDKLKVILQEPGVINVRKNTWFNVTLFKSANDQSIRELLNDKFHMTLHSRDPVHSYVIDGVSESITNVAERKLPKNLKTAPLELEHAHAMHAAYEYGEPPPLSRFENTIRYQQNLAIFNEKDEPISWAVVKEYGDIGMTYTVPSYRRQGLASFLTAKLVVMALQANEIPFITISRLNEASAAMHTKLGFKRQGEEWTFNLYRQDTN